ncbi:MAG: hypothetical protein Kow00122_14340 [Thermoleophilia bacterium]
MVGLSLALLVLVFAYARVREPGEATMTTLKAGSAGRPVFAYAVSPPADRPFRPRGAAFSGGKVFVADSEGARIAILDMTRGQDVELAFIPVAPDRPAGKLPRAPQPTSVVVGSDGVLLAADPANGRIWRLTQDGVLLGAFPPENERLRSKLGEPVGLALSGEELYVTDVKDQTVKVYTISGRFLREFGAPGVLPGRLSYANGLAVSADGRTVYVADSNNRRVQVFGSDGAPQAVIKTTGNPEGMGLPRALGFDRFGRLHVVDTFAQAVYVYDARNQLVLTYGTGPRSEERLNLPEGIALSGDTIVVSDGGNRRLVIYRY